MNDSKFPHVELWRDEDGFIANGKGDEYTTFATTNVNNLDIDDREMNTEFLIIAGNSYHDMYEALKKIIRDANDTLSNLKDPIGRAVAANLRKTAKAALSKANPK